MLPTTIDLLKSALKTDPTVSASERTKIIELLRRGPAPPAPRPTRPPDCARVFSRKATAHLIGDRSLRYVDRLAQQGLLKKVILPGRKRAIGFAASEVEALIAGNVAMTRDAV